jgi:hypothetical protein
LARDPDAGGEIIGTLILLLFRTLTGLLEQGFEFGVCSNNGMVV